MSKPSRLPLPKKDLIEEIIRVDHAGEYGAKRIYEGQLSIIKHSSARSEIEKMYSQELEHLNYFQKAILENNVRPTMLYPLWNVLGFAMGAATAILGPKSAMACTVAVEDVIEEHYQSQINALEMVGGHNPLLEKLKKFRMEEIEHKHAGLEHGAEEAGNYWAIYRAVQAISKVAIFLSKRI